MSNDLDGGDGQIGKPDKTVESQETAVEKEPAGSHTDFIFGLQSSVKISENKDQRTFDLFNTVSKISK